MKQWLRSIVPNSIRRLYQRIKINRESERNKNLTPEQVFSEIYKQGKWGKGSDPFCSGSGTIDDSISQPYVSAVRSFLQSFPRQKPRVVDLGCGDFRIGRQLVEDCETYTGVDVVPDLLQHHRNTYVDPRVQFVCLDITRDELPAGDICLIRQVLQHLSNDQIVSVLSKLGQYSAVIITEHYPTDDTKAIPNRDKVHGCGIRLFDNSGVYLDKPPFNVPANAMKQILQVQGHEFDGLYDPGVIRTYSISLGAKQSDAG